MSSITITINDLKDKSTPEIQVEAFDVQYKKLEEEFEETIRGELMNLKSVKKHLFAFLTPRSCDLTNDCITDPDLNMAYKIVKDDVEALEKFVNERWGE